MRQDDRAVANKRGAVQRYLASRALGFLDEVTSCFLGGLENLLGTVCSSSSRQCCACHPEKGTHVGLCARQRDARFDDSLSRQFKVGDTLLG